MHADDRFHPPTSGDSFRTETCWFTFPVPERRLDAEETRPDPIGLHTNPDLLTRNGLTDWRWDEAQRALGEDHDDWRASAAPRFFRARATGG